MSKRLKRVLRIIKNPKDVTFEDLECVLLEFGFNKGEGSGDHFTFRKEGEPLIITVPKKHPVKSIYVKQVIKLLDLEAWYEENN